MTRCSFCNATILFGGMQVGDHVFCNARCHLKGRSLMLAPGEQDVTELHAIITALYDDLLRLAEELGEVRSALSETNERLDFSERTVMELRAMIQNPLDR